MERKFQNIINDKKSGSAEILHNIISWLYDLTIDGKSVMKEIRTAEQQLRHFAIVQNYLVQLRKIVEKKDRKALLEYLSFYIEDEKNIYLTIFNALPYEIKISRNIITLSNSKTVYEILKLWYQHNKKIKISVLDSQPGGEGKILARSLTSSGITSEVVMDSALSSSLEKSDLLLMGCDIILKNGSIVNKTGSRNAAIIAKHFRKPVVVVSARAKRINKNKYKISSSKPDAKFLFERVEKELITHLITDYKHRIK